jgi:hypothetical protein
MGWEKGGRSRGRRDKEGDRPKEEEGEGARRQAYGRRGERSKETGLGEEGKKVSRRHV